LVELLLLGPVEAGLVAAVLALAVNRPVSVERLVGLMWPHDPPATARGMVHTYVCGLRALLGRMWTLRTALALWRGPAVRRTPSRRDGGGRDELGSGDGQNGGSGPEG
jgi:hypothetical protein